MRRQKNTCFEIIQAAHLSPAEFLWVDVDPRGNRNTCSELRHPTSGYYFRFDRNDLEWSPDSSQRIAGSPSRFGHDWSAMLSEFKKWVGYIADELSVPDLWDAVRTAGELPSVSQDPGLSNAPFTAAEQQYLSKQLEEIKEFVFKTVQLEEGQKAFLEARFEYFDESSRRLGRKDWLNLFMGALLGTVINLAVPQDNIGDLFRFAGTALRHLFSTPVGLPGF